MSKDELKYEISKVLDHFSENALEELYAYLKQLEVKDPNVLFDAKHLHKVLSEDKELLQKLAK
jgi:hypothetical protein